jgi:hypothetical protein
MNELIKREAEKYSNNCCRQYYCSCDSAFVTGFNRCLELSKQDNEEAFFHWWKNQNQESFFSKELAARDVFLAATKLKDDRIMELDSWVKHHQQCIELSRQREHELESKLVAVTNFWKPIIKKFETKYPNAGNANTLALTSLTEAFDIHCKNEELEKKLAETNELNTKRINKQVDHIEKLHNKLSVAVEALREVFRINEEHEGFFSKGDNIHSFCIEYSKAFKNIVE